MSQLSFTTDRRNGFKVYAENIRRGTRRLMAALFDERGGKQTPVQQAIGLQQGKVGTSELKKLYRMMGGFDSVSRDVTNELDMISRRRQAPGTSDCIKKS